MRSLADATYAMSWKRTRQGFADSLGPRFVYNLNLNYLFRFLIVQNVSSKWQQCVLRDVSYRDNLRESA